LASGIFRADALVIIIRAPNTLGLTWAAVYRPALGGDCSDAGLVAVLVLAERRLIERERRHTRRGSWCGHGSR
jgi:hypothetical protein